MKKLLKGFSALAGIALVIQMTTPQFARGVAIDFVPVTLCHATGNGSFVEITVSTQGALNGHLGHEDDIIPKPENGCPSGEQTPPPPSETPPPPSNITPPPPGEHHDDEDSNDGDDDHHDGDHGHKQCTEGAGYATTVVEADQGTLKNGNPITDPTRTNPNKTLGAPDNQFFSLGKGGNVVLSFTNFPINVTGNDVSIYEITNGRDTYPEEKAKVEISQDGTTWHTVGTASGTDAGGISSQDIALTTLTWFKLIRISDTTNFALHDVTADGYDLDAVGIVYGACSTVQLTKDGTYSTVDGTITYAINWSVIGKGSVSPLTISDSMPTGTMYVPASADNGGTYDSLLDTVKWNLGTKNAGQSGSVHFKVTVDQALSQHPWAQTVVHFSQGSRADSTPVSVDRSDPTTALGPAESVGLLYDNPALAYIGKFVSLGFTDDPQGGELTVAFDHPVINGPGADLSVYEITGGDTYPDETARVFVSDDNSTWDNVGVVVRDGTVDLGSHASANYVRIVGTANVQNFQGDADNYDVDAVKALQLLPKLCSIDNQAEAWWVADDTDVNTFAKTTTIINKDACTDPHGTISGQKYADVNGNGTKDENENGLPNWTIYLDANDNGVLDNGEQSTVTDENGNYSFANVPSGMYIIREVGKAGWKQITPDEDSQSKYVVFVTSGNSTGKDFGNQNTGDTGGTDEGDGNNGGNTPPPPSGGLGSITGVVFSDDNNNGILDSGEASLSGWVVFLDTNDNGVLDPGEQSKTTASPYLFTGLADGTYTVREVQQVDWNQTLPTSANNFKYTVTIAGGAAITGKDFGNFHTVSGGGGPITTSGTNGGGGGGAALPPPTGRILGDTTTVPSGDTGLGGSGEPKVLGDSTQLPRTGSEIPFNVLIPLTIPLFAILTGRRKKQ